MPVYQNGNRNDGMSVSKSSGSAQDGSEMQQLLAQIATLTKGMAATQGLQFEANDGIDPAEAIQRLAEAGAKIKDGKIVDDGIGDKDVVKSDEKSKKTLDLLNNL